MQTYELHILGRDPFVDNTWTDVSYHAQIQTAIKSAIEKTRGLEDVLRITISMDAGNEGPTYYVYIGDELGPRLDPTFVSEVLSSEWHFHVGRHSNEWHELDA